MYKILIFMSLFACYLGKNDTYNPNHGRILGGVPTDIADHPYLVSLEHKRQHWCGGSIISPEWVITSAHCVNGLDASSFTIRTGSSFISNGGVLYFASSVAAHPCFGSASRDCDLGLVKASKPIVYSNTVKPISLTNEEPTPGTAVVVSGWGSSYIGGPTSPKVQKVEIKIVNRTECRELYTGSAKITQNMLCAGVFGGGKSACGGDSGGPLVANNRLVGIVSFGKRCGDRYYPGVYSNVASLKQWVTQMTGVGR